MPNHYQNIVLCWRDYDHANGGEFDCAGFVKRHSDGLFELLNPEPPELCHANPRYLSSASCEWRLREWGTKWDAYNLRAIVLDGDGSPAMLSFVTAWSAPCESMRDKISAWLLCEYGLRGAAWIGLDPYDASTVNNGGKWNV